MSKTEVKFSELIDEMMTSGDVASVDIDIPMEIDPQIDIDWDSLIPDEDNYTIDDVMDMITLLNEDQLNEVALIISEMIDSTYGNIEDMDNMDESIKHLTSGQKIAAKKYRKTVAYKKKDRLKKKMQQFCKAGYTYSVRSKKCTKIDKKRSKTARKIAKYRRD